MDVSWLLSFSTLWLAFEWLLRLLALFVVPRNRHPTASLTWLMVIFLVPLLGWPLYILIGSTKLPRRRRLAKAQLLLLLRHIERDNTAPEVVPEKYRHLAKLTEALTGMGVRTAEDWQLLTRYAESLRAMAADVAQARCYVHMEFYTFVADGETEELIRALEQAARRGVTVRVLYDAFGSYRYGRAFLRTRKRLHQAGAHMQAALTLRLPGRGYTRVDLRNHRKLVVIDGEVVYAGSQNIIARNYHRWDSIVYSELMIRMTGSIVSQFEAIFLEDWYAETRQLVGDAAHPHPSEDDGVGGAKVQLLPSGPEFEYDNNIKLFCAAIYAASQSVTIINPYFVPDESLMQAIISASNRGVRVRIINSAVMDQWMAAHAQRSYYEELLRAGVDIYLHKAPVLVHTKAMVIDDDMAMIGSSNMDMRSFQLNHETTVLAYNTQIAAGLLALADRYIAEANQLALPQWLRRRPSKQLLDNIARLTSSLQ